MTGKIIGAVLIIFGCGFWGFSITAGIKTEEHSLRQLINTLDYMQCELQYRMTPLPDLCHMAAQEQKNRIGKFFYHLSTELENQISPDVSCCVRGALSSVPGMPEKTVKALELLGMFLGRFDASGQISGLETVRGFCRSELEAMSVNRDARLRSYQTLGICAGAALAILFV